MKTFRKIIVVALTFLILGVRPDSNSSESGAYAPPESAAIDPQLAGRLLDGIEFLLGEIEREKVTGD